MSDLEPRYVCNFSCGAASAVATKLTLATHPDALIVNAFIEEENADNRRFLADCELWFGKAITVLRDEKYGASAHEVFRQRGYMKGPHGAPCSTYLKRKLLNSILKPGDVVVLGFTCEEAERFVDFRAYNTALSVSAPLIDRGIGKDDAKAMVERAGIALPLMYRLGYHNANCEGCVKGGMGYFRAIRADFPERFEALAKVQDAIGPGAYLHYDRKTGIRFSLRELGDGPITRNEALPNCSFFCEAAEREYLTKPEAA